MERVAVTTPAILDYSAMVSSMTQSDVHEKRGGRAGRYRMREAK